MKLHRSVKDTILRAIENDPSISLEIVVEYIAKYAGVPDIQRLVQQDYRATARRLLAGSRDESGVRNIFAADDRRGTFVNLPVADDVAQIKRVVKQLQQKRDGINASLAKARLRGRVVAGQIGIFDSDFAVGNE